MLKVLSVVCACILLSACESFGDLTSDAFDPGDTAPSRFALDSVQCEAQAGTERDYSNDGIMGSDSDRHEIFNRAYSDCMTRDGYPRRDWSIRIPSPYVIDSGPTGTQ